MSLYDYRESLTLSANDVGFYALIMAAMLKADTENIAKLKMCWPEIWDELYKRYHAPGGFLPGEEQDEEITHVNQRRK